MPVDFAASDQVRQLRRVGVRPSEALVRAILKSFDAAYPALIELATSVDLLHEDEPECFGPIHALRLLGEQPRPEMIAPLLREIPVELDYADEELPETWTNEVPQLVGKLGAAAIEPLWELVDGEDLNDEARGTALVALSCVAVAAPETRDAIVARLRDQLGSATNQDIATYTVAALASLGVNEAYPEIMRLYRDGKLNQEVLPAGAAR